MIVARKFISKMKMYDVTTRVLKFCLLQQSLSFFIQKEINKIGCFEMMGLFMEWEHQRHIFYTSLSFLCSPSTHRLF